MSRGRMLVAALVAAVTVLGPLPATAADDDLTTAPLWVYGHSYTTNPGSQNTPGQEWMPELAADLGSPSWQTFGIGSSRMIDTYSDIARQAPKSPVASSAWDPRRDGVVVVQSEFNDMINPAGVSRDARVQSTLSVKNYEQTLYAALALLSSERRQDWSTATSRGTWRSSAGPAYLGGSLVYTTQQGAYREMRVDVGASGTIWLFTWEVSNRVSNPRTGTTRIAVDGRNVTGIPARTASWEAILSRRGGGYLHSVGPRATVITGLTPGIHTVRVTKDDSGPGAVYLDQLTVQAADPVPVVVVKDPPAYLPASSYTLASGPTINANRALLHPMIDAATARPVFPHVVTATLEGIQPQHYSADGIHLSDVGMEFEASRLEEAIRLHFSGSPAGP
jgi:lysophospholipase L1-like esterase